MQELASLCVSRCSVFPQSSRFLKLCSPSVHTQQVFPGSQYQHKISASAGRTTVSNFVHSSKILTLNETNPQTKLQTNVPQPPFLSKVENRRLEGKFYTLATVLCSCWRSTLGQACCFYLCSTHGDTSACQS